MNTHEFVEKFQDNQRKARKNRSRGKGTPGARLANKQHSSNK